MDEKKEILKRYEDLISALDLINVNVPVLKDIQSSITEAQENVKKENKKLEEAQKDVSSLQDQFKSRIDTQVSIAENYRKAAERARDEAKKSAEYVKTQEEKFNECLNYILEVKQMVDDINENFHKFVEDYKSNNGSRPAVDEGHDNIWADNNSETEEYEFQEFESNDGNIRVLIDDDVDKIQIHFKNASFSAAYRDEMKKNGFRWFAPDKCWTAPINEDNYDFASWVVEDYDSI